MNFGEAGEDAVFYGGVDAVAALDLIDFIMPLAAHEHGEFHLFARGRASAGGFQAPRAFGAGGDLEFEIEHRQHGEEGFDFDGGIAVLDDGDGGLTQAGLRAEFLLAPFAVFAGAPDQVANLPGITGQSIHGVIMRQSE